MKKIIISVLILFFQFENSNAQGFLFAKIYCDSTEGIVSSISETNDGNLIACGNFFYSHQYAVGMMLKLDMNGNLIWQKNFHSIHSSSTVKQTIDNGYILYGEGDTIIAGNTIERMCVIKTNSTGDSLWTISIPGSGFLNNLEITSDGGFITCSFDTGLCLTKISSAGIIEWQNNYNSTGCKKVVQTYDGGFMIAGGLTLLKTDSVGGMMWDTSFTNFFELTSLVKLQDSNVVVIGRTGNYSLIGIWKYDINGTQISFDSLVAPNNIVNYGSAQSSDGGFVITGDVLDTSSKFYCIKFNSQCQQQWNYKYNNPNPVAVSGFEDCFNALQSSLNGNYYLVGGTQIILDTYYPTLVCLSPWATSTQNLFPSNNTYCTITSTLNCDVEILFPKEENYSLSVFDLSGKLLNQLDGNSGEVRKNFNLSSGVYLLEVKTKEGVTSKLFSVAN